MNGNHAGAGIAVLLGKRIVITRARAQADELGAQNRRAGWRGDRIPND